MSVALLLWAEMIQIVIVGLCLLAALHTLSDAINSRRKVMRSTPDKDLALIGWNNIRGKLSAFVAVAVVLVTKVDRFFLLSHNYFPPMIVRWNCYGLAFTFAASFFAMTAWLNMRSYHKMRDDGA